MMSHPSVMAIATLAVLGVLVAACCEAPGGVDTNSESLGHLEQIDDHVISIQVDTVASGSTELFHDSKLVDKITIANRKYTDPLLNQEIIAIREALHTAMQATPTGNKILLRSVDDKKSSTTGIIGEWNQEALETLKVSSINTEAPSLGDIDGMYLLAPVLRDDGTQLQTLFGSTVYTRIKIKINPKLKKQYDQIRKPELDPEKNIACEKICECLSSSCPVKKNAKENWHSSN